MTSPAARIEGTVQHWSEDASYEVWLTSSLDLTEGPTLRSTVEARTGHFELDLEGLRGPHWLFLNETIAPEGGVPEQLFLPLDLEPFEASEPPESVSFRSVSPAMAQLRQAGEPVPGWWLSPLVLVLLVYGMALAGRWLIRWRLQMVAGARLLLDAMNPDRPARTASGDLLRDTPPPRGGQAPPPPVSKAEGWTITALLAAAVGLRLPGMLRQPFDLLEHTYGPGSLRIDPQGTSLRTLVEDLLIQPSSVEVTHPPLYHWLLALLGLLGDGEWLLRLPALAASVATAALIWHLLRRLSVPAGLLGAGMFAAAAPAVHFGRDATPYAWSGLVAVASVVLLLRALEVGSDRTWRSWLGLLALGFLTHYVVALFALAQVMAVTVVACVRYRSAAWLAALHRALGAGMIVAPLPLAWSFVHFAWFDPVALDTRLFADTYPSDPGLGVFVREFGSVTAGVPPDMPLAAGTLGLLAGLGLMHLLRRDRPLGLLLLAMAGAFVGGTVFLHTNLTHHLDGRVFYAFRWVSWFHPLLIALAALGLAPGRAEPTIGRRKNLATQPLPPSRGQQRISILIRSILGLGWAAVAITFTASLNTHTTRPDYRAAAEHILPELADRDAVATLPMWAQRGPMTWYLTRGKGTRFAGVEGVTSWHIGGHRVFLEAIHEGLPFESSARNAHFERLWVVEVDERMFGRPKFAPDVAERALAWANEHLVSETSWEGDGIRVHRFSRPTRDLVWSGRPLTLEVPERSLENLAYLEPNTAGCDVDDAAARWVLNVRVPLPSDLEGLEVRAESGSLTRRDEEGVLAGRLLGGPCVGPPPRLHLSSGLEPD